MRLYVKNMVCNRCILAVEQTLEKEGIEQAKVTLGEIELDKTIPPDQQKKLGESLASLGFELLENAKNQIIEKLKTTIIQLVHHSDEMSPLKYSEKLSKALNKDYSYLSHLFSEVEGMTIEKYIILQKIERVKELITYDELSLSEIAFQLGYSSVSHLSNQFKKTTGLTPGHFRKIRNSKRKPLDSV